MGEEEEDCSYGTGDMRLASLCPLDFLEFVPMVSRSHMRVEQWSFLLKSW